jgi:dolichol kinase
VEERSESLSPERVSLLRKLIHVAMTVVPVAGWLVAYSLAIALGAVILAASLVIELARRWWPWVNRTLWGIVPSVFRAWEGRRVLGSTWFALGALAALLLFGRDAGGTAILFLAWGDPAAELAGRRWGLPGQRKTLVGSLTCLAACVAAAGVGIILGGIAPWVAFSGAVVATLVERWSPPPDDNVWVPILSGLAMIVGQSIAARW